VLRGTVAAPRAPWKATVSLEFRWQRYRVPCCPLLRTGLFPNKHAIIPKRGCGPTEKRSRHSIRFPGEANRFALEARARVSYTNNHVSTPRSRRLGPDEKYMIVRRRGYRLAKAFGNANPRVPCLAVSIFVRVRATRNRVSLAIVSSSVVTGMLSNWILLNSARFRMTKLDAVANGTRCRLQRYQYPFPSSILEWRSVGRARLKEVLGAAVGFQKTDFWVHALINALEV